MNINRIVIHCAATGNGRILANERQSAAQRIDDWHKGRGFRRSAAAKAAFNEHLNHIGYHFVIDCDGTLGSGRAVGEIGAHVAGYNKGSIGICLVGTERFTKSQWLSLRELVAALSAKYPAAEICGHRDLSPDQDGDGKIEAHEWTKLCPGFDVQAWLAGGCGIPAGHLCEVAYDN